MGKGDIRRIGEDGKREGRVEKDEMRG